MSLCRLLISVKNSALQKWRRLMYSQLTPIRILAEFMKPEAESAIPANPFSAQKS
jgi:hypothetical protein